MPNISWLKNLHYKCSFRYPKFLGDMNVSDGGNLNVYACV